MSKQSGLVQLLGVEAQRSLSLLYMQAEIERGDFVSAMRYQLSYLFGHDEYIELFEKHHDELWALKLAVLGLDNHV